jgi:hypothetical protein
VGGLVVSGCGNDEDYGKLTINNLPSIPGGWDGGVYFDSGDITSQRQTMLGDVFKSVNLVAEFKNPDFSKVTKSPFNLTDNKASSIQKGFGVEYLAGWTETGTYIVMIYSLQKGITILGNEYYRFMYVPFKNGIATINYNEMTRVDSLREWW